SHFERYARRVVIKFYNMNLVFDFIILIFIVVSLFSHQPAIAVACLIVGFVAELADHQRQIEILKDKLEDKEDND
ncbi:MAG: hypothetical protein PHU94_05470, partial [Bacilli bacterium]|nr:hypothetical protein [Bacilli bacterium]